MKGRKIEEIGVSFGGMYIRTIGDIGRIYALQI